MSLIFSVHLPVAWTKRVYPVNREGDGGVGGPMNVFFSLMFRISFAHSPVNYLRGPGCRSSWSMGVREINLDRINRVGAPCLLSFFGARPVLLVCSSSWHTLSPVFGLVTSWGTGVRAKNIYLGVLPFVNIPPPLRPGCIPLGDTVCVQMIISFFFSFL